MRSASLSWTARSGRRRLDATRGSWGFIVEVVAAIIESDIDLTARFVRETQPVLDALRRRARWLSLHDVDAEDLVQDVLLNAYKGFRTYRDGTNVKAWLFRILHNQWISRHRYDQRRPPEMLVDTVLDVVDPRARAGHRSAEDEALSALPNSEVTAALGALPDGFRIAIYYADVLGYTYAETAAILGVPIGTVMSRVSRGRQRLRLALVHLAPEEDDDVAA